MDKKEYLKNRFKGDFLQYSLLQEGSLSAKEIAEKLWGIISYVASSILILFAYDKLYALINKSKLRQ